MQKSGAIAEGEPPAKRPVGSEDIPTSWDLLNYCWGTDASVRPIEKCSLGFLDENKRDGGCPWCSGCIVAVGISCQFSPANASSHEPSYFLQFVVVRKHSTHTLLPIFLFAPFLTCPSYLLDGLYMKGTSQVLNTTRYDVHVCTLETSIV